MFDIDIDEIAEKLKGLIVLVAVKAVPGKEKMREVLHEAAEWLASKTPLPDAIEIPVYQTLLRGLAQFLYAQLKKQGQV